MRHSDDVDAQAVSAGTATQVQVLLGADDGMPNFAMRRFRMGRGGGMPRHTNLVEHEQYVLRGRARITIGGNEHLVGPDDVVYIPAGIPHDYTVLEAPFEFLCVVPNTRDHVELFKPQDQTGKIVAP